MSSDSPIAASVALEGGGEAGDLIRTMDWGKSPLGSISDWPPSLLRAIASILKSPLSSNIQWGHEHAVIYNDALRSTLGEKHPAAMGQMAKDIWPEAWGFLEPIMKRVMRFGEIDWLEQHMVPLRRRGFLEEAYFTVSISPIWEESGGVGGILSIGKDVTNQVIGERRANFITRLSSQAMIGKSPEETARLTSECLGQNRWDIPFSLLYLLDEGKNEAHLAGTSGIVPGSQAAPPHINLSDASESFWPLHAILNTTPPTLIEDLGSPIELLADSPWPESPRAAVGFPIMDLAKGHLAGVLIIGKSPGLALDYGYRGFMQLVADQIAHSLALSRANIETEQEITWLKALFTQVPAAICIQRGPEHVFTFANPSYYKLSHRRNLIGKTAKEAFPELESQKIFEILDNVYRGETYTIQEQAVSIDRGQGPEQGYYRFNIQPMRNTQGEIEGIMTLAFDITGEVLARQMVETTAANLVAQKTVLESIARRVPLPEVLETLVDNAQILFKGSCAVIFMLSREKRLLLEGISPCLPQEYLRVIQERPLEDLACICAAAASTGDKLVIGDISTHPHWKDKEESALSCGFKACWCLPISSSSGEILAVFALYFTETRHPNTEEMTRFETLTRIVGIAIEQDATEKFLRHTQDQLLQAQKMESIGKLAGGIAHDFNNLLTAISGYTEISMAMVGKEDLIYGNLMEIKNAGERAAELTRQLLAYSRKEIFASKVVELNSLVKNLGKMLERIIGENIGLELKLGSGLGLVNVDPGKIEQVILNLVVNARDAIHGGGQITIETSQVEISPREAQGLSSLVPGTYVLLSVTDNGIGMSKEVQAQAFEPFFTTKEFGKGSGLGLAMVYGIISQSGGHIFIDSEEGKGTSFTIYLPVIEGGKTEPSVPEALEFTATSQSATILLVEDEVTVRRLIRNLLEINGYKVLEAKDGVEGVEMARNYSGRIDLVVSDVVMPRMDGVRMVQELRSHFEDMRVLLMSGYVESSPVKKALKTGHTHFIQKPFMPKRILDEIRELLKIPTVS